MKIEGIAPQLLGVVRDKLEKAGAAITEGEDWIALDMQDRRPKAVDIVTEPYPDFPLICRRSSPL